MYINDLIKKASLFLALANEEVSIRDKSLKLNNVAQQAKEDLCSYWSNDEPYQKLASFYNKKNPKTNLSLDQIKQRLMQKIIDGIKNVPVLLISDEKWKISHPPQKESGERALASYYPNKNRIEVQNKVVETQDDASLLTALKHEMSHAVFKTLKDERFYSEQSIKSFIQDSENVFGNKIPYLIDPDEQFARLGSIRSLFGSSITIDAFVAKMQQIGLNLVKNASNANYLVPYQDFSQWQKNLDNVINSIEAETLVTMISPFIVKKINQNNQYYLEINVAGIVNMFNQLAKNELQQNNTRMV